MDNRNWEQIETIIDQVLALPEEKRKSYIHYTCQNDNELKSEVTLLLESIFDSEGWLENPKEYKEDLLPDIKGDQDVAPRSLIGTEIGAYRIEQKLGKGGMGSVYLAERVDGEFNHTVAIKIIRNEKASAENIRRFEQERTILAGLNHLGIAKLFDGGITKDGAPYFVMEYVDGIPIDQFCEEQDFNISEKIELFKQILQAVRHAHENLVVHRDLKPGNILVNESGQVKILDFGISKLLQEDQMAGAHLIKTTARLLTPKYAAPEQILQSSVTTATDIYALGIVFYKLLAGSHPFDLDELSQFEMEQTILEEAPPKPSSKGSSSAHQKILLRDLDAIALKAIRKEPEQRYRVANDFLDDLNKFQQGLPVTAREGSMQYRVRKFFRRHKQGTATIAGVVFLLIGFLGFYYWQIAEERNRAQTEAQKAQQVKNLLLNLFEANDPILADGESVTLAGLLEAGTNQIIEKEIDPTVKSEMLLTLSTIYENIEDYDQASTIAEKSLAFNTDNFGSNSVNSAKSLIQLGNIEDDLGNYEEGNEYFIKAENLLNDQLQGSDPLMANLYAHLGNSEEHLSNYESAAVYYQQSLDILNTQANIDSADYIDVLRNVARASYLSHFHIEDIEKADSLYLFALKMSNNFYGENHIVTSSVMNDIGMFYMTQARYDEAREYYNRSLKIKDVVYGDKGHSNYSATLNNLAVLEKTFSNFTIAESLFIRTLDMDLGIFGENHPNVAISKNQLADIYFETGDYAKSRKFREEALEMYIDFYGPEHSYLGTSYRDYAQLLSVQGEYEKAEEYLIKTDSIYTKYLVPGDSRFARLHHIRAENYYRTKNYNSAIPKYELAAVTYDSISPQYDYYRRMAAKCRIRLGQSYTALGEQNKAESIFKNLKVQIDTTGALTTSDEINRLYSEALESTKSDF